MQDILIVYDSKTGNTEKVAKALAEAAGEADREITAETISFALAPRLNAAGRMNDAALALRLLWQDTGLTRAHRMRR